MPLANQETMHDWERRWPSAVGSRNVLDMSLEMEFGDHLLVSDIAARVGVHPNYLSKRFSSAFGMSPKRFLTQVRLERARRLILETDASIGTIARSVGFDDALSFSKVFSRNYSMPPTKYRACQKSKDLDSGDGEEA